MHISKKITLHSEGFNKLKLDEQLKGDIAHLNAIPRLARTEKGAYEYEMAYRFFLEEKKAFAARFFFLSTLANYQAADSLRGIVRNIILNIFVLVIRYFMQKSSKYFISS